MGIEEIKLLCPFLFSEFFLNKKEESNIIKQ